MDWNYLYSLVAFMIGGLAGFQGVYERYKKDSPKASTTLPGFFYLLTRAAFPAAIFAGLYGSGLIDSKLLLTSLACGACAELFLRTKFFIKQEQRGPGNIEDLLKGPLDLLRWYQNLFLEAASTGLAQSRKAFVDKHLPAAVKFQDLCERVLRNIEAYNPPRPDLKTEIEKLKEEFDKKQVDERSLAELAIKTTMENLKVSQEEAIACLAARPETADFVRAIGNIADPSLDPAKIEQQYRYKLGYLIYNHVGPKGFITLLFR